MVRGPAGREELVADALAVEVELVEAEAGDVETRRAHAVVNTKGPSQEWRRRWEAIRRRCLRAYPAGRPVRGLQQSGFPKLDRAPWRLAAAVVPDAHAPVIARPRHRGRAAEGHEDRGVGHHSAGIPQQIYATRQARFAGRDLQLIRSLRRVAPGARDPPAQPRLHHVDADRICEILDAQSGDRECGLREHLRWCKHGQWQDDHDAKGHLVCTACPPNSLRSAAITLAPKDSSWRERSRASSDNVMTGAGTFRRIASSTVQRPSPESST